MVNLGMLISKIDVQNIKIAISNLPPVFERLETGIYMMRGDELKLTPLGHAELEDDKFYKFHGMYFQAVNHYRRARHAFEMGMKRGGLEMAKLELAKYLYYIKQLAQQTPKNHVIELPSKRAGDHQSGVQMCN